MAFKREDLFAMVIDKSNIHHISANTIADAMEKYHESNCFDVDLEKGEWCWERPITNERVNEKMKIGEMREYDYELFAKGVPEGVIGVYALLKNVEDVRGFMGIMQKTVSKLDYD